MRKLCALLACVSWLSVSSVHAEPPRDDPRPPTGWIGIGVGLGGFAFTVFQLASMPVCYADWYPTETGVCLGTSTALAAAGLAVGITGVVIGKRRRAEYKAWKQRELQRRGIVVDGLSVGYHAGQGKLQLQLRF